MTPPAITMMSLAPRSSSSRKSFGKHRELHAGEEADAEHVDVLLDGGVDDFLGRAVQAGVDDVHAGVAQRAGDDLDAAVMAVEADLGEENADRGDVI